jgi:hypothetical protein
MFIKYLLTKFKIKMKKTLLFFGLLVLSICFLQAQTLFRSGIFLHHSTGANIWGPNGASTTIPIQMTNYNTAHTYTGVYAVTMNEEWWAPSDNEWSTQHDFFEDPSPVTGIGYYLPTNKIIVIKSCFPSSAIEAVGQASDTLNPTYKSIYNYKWHWRHILNVMRSHPGNFFVIWTNAPLVAGATNATEALNSHRFCKWAKDTLAAGLDPVFGAFPSNVYVFDFFHKLTDANGYLMSQYAQSGSDSHPNTAATNLVAPQFVSEIFNASIAYESLYNGIPEINNENIIVLENTPNPFSQFTNISFTIPEQMQIQLNIYDVNGKFIKQLINEIKPKGMYALSFNSLNLESGFYYYRLKTDKTTITKKMLIIH